MRRLFNVYSTACRSARHLNAPPFSAIASILNESAKVIVRSGRLPTVRNTCQLPGTSQIASRPCADAEHILGRTSHRFGSRVALATSLVRFTLPDRARPLATIPLPRQALDLQCSRRLGETVVDGFAPKPGWRIHGPHRKYAFFLRSTRAPRCFRIGLG